MNEIWRDIKVYEGLYQVSSLGRVKSLRTNKIKSNRITNGYYYVSLWKDNTEKQLKVSRLVAEAFIPNPDNLPCVNHKDENKLNNTVENLEWCTYKYNSNYGTKNERMILTRNLKCSSNAEKPVVKYTLNDEFMAEYPSISIAAKENNVLQQHIVRVCKLKRKSCKGYKYKYKQINNE